MKKEEKTLLGGLAVLAALGGGYYFMQKKKKDEETKKKPQITVTPQGAMAQGMPQSLPAGMPAIPVPAVPPAPQGTGATPVSAAQDALNQAAAAAGLPTAPKVF